MLWLLLGESLNVFILKHETERVVSEITLVDYFGWDPDRSGSFQYPGVKEFQKLS